MPLPSPSQPWPPESDGDRPDRPAEDGYVSEFLSEQSPEFQAVRQAVAEARPLPPQAGLPGGDAAAGFGYASSRGESRTSARPVPWGLLILLIATAVGLTAYLVARGRPADGSPSASRPAIAEGLATIISRPAGAEVFIDGTARGVTPLKLSLPVGSYTVELKNGSAKRSLTLTVDAATSTREFVDLAPGAGVGRLEVTTETPGARVWIDGTPSGVTPLTVENLEPKTYRIAVGAAGGMVNRTVQIVAGGTATVAAAVPPPGSSGGFLTITAPIEMQIIENGQVIGTTGADRIMLPAGAHELELVASAFEFRTVLVAEVRAGRSATVPVTVPTGSLSINAQPWADVWLDDRPLGSTPLANIAVPIGNHNVIWRHPQLGERRQTIRVTAQTPTRVGMDLSR